MRDFSAVPREVGLEVAELVRAAVPGTVFAVEHVSGWASETAFPRHPDDREDRTQGAWADIYRDDVVKILAVHRDLGPEDFWRRVEDAVGDLVTCTWSSTHALVEISAEGVTKATTLATLAEEMGVGGPWVVHQRARRGRLPYVMGSDGTRWFRRDLVEMAVRAQLASRSKRIAGIPAPSPAGSASPPERARPVPGPGGEAQA